MKKILLMLCSVLFLATSASAESINFDELTIDELLELRGRINAEISKRLTETEIVFYPFDYVVGTDIPAGRYIITGESGVSPYGCIYLCSTGTENFSWLCYLDVGEEYAIELEEGDILRIKDCTVTIRRYIVPSI